MYYRILFFLALCLSVRQIQMPLEGLSFVKTLATFAIIDAMGSLIQNITRNYYLTIVRLYGTFVVRIVLRRYRYF